MRKLLIIILFILGIVRHGYAQYPFTQIDTNFFTTTVQLPAGYSFTPLFSEFDPVVVSGGLTYPAKGVNDYIMYIPINGSSTDGWLFVNHETRDSNTFLEDGGGVTTFRVTRTGSTWTATSPFRHMAFNHIGGTINNCAGSSSILVNGNVLSAEEYAPNSNAELYNSGRNYRDTSDFGGYKRYLNFGWMVECNAAQDTAYRKLFNMGRYSHEAALCMPDGRTVYLPDDFTGGCLFKFVANNFGDYTNGQLYAYKQVGSSGTWLPMPMNRDSMNIARNVALRLGATIFIRLEDIDIDNQGMIYISETGADSANLSSSINLGGVPANHLASTYIPSTGRYDNPYGRVLKLDPATGGMTVYLQGGTASDVKTNFASVDNLAVDRARNLLVLQEDLIGQTRNRNPSYVPLGDPNYICEMYYIDLNNQSPSVNDIKRFSIFPKGSEVTGAVFTPDFNTMFVDIQHPSTSNPAPFNKSTTVAITGFPPLGIQSQGGIPSGFALKQNYPNPFNPSTNISFEVAKDGNVSLKVYNIEGQLITTLVDQRLITGKYNTDFSAANFPSGVYFYKLVAGDFSETKKMMLIK